MPVENTMEQGSPAEDGEATNMLGYFEAFKGTEQYEAIEQGLRLVGLTPDDLDRIPPEDAEEAKSLVDQISSADDEQEALEAAQKLDGLVWEDLH